MTKRKLRICRKPTIEYPHGSTEVVEIDNINCKSTQGNSEKRVVVDNE